MAVAARAQRPERVRLIAMLTANNDPEMNAFEQELEVHVTVTQTHAPEPRAPVAGVAAG